MLAAVGGYLIGDSLKSNQFANGGMTGDVSHIKDSSPINLKVVLPPKTIRFKIASIIGVDKALKYLGKDYVVSPFYLIEAAVRKGFITIEEIDENLWNEAVSEAEDIDDSGKGIGSSDMNAFISRMLNSAGIKVGVIDNKYTRLID